MGFHRECDDDGPPWQFSTQLLSIQSSFLDQEVHYLLADLGLPILNIDLGIYWVLSKF